MIDIHAHILPDLDDGPADMEASVGMGLIAAQEGITGIISTSHGDEATIVGYEAMQARLEAVRKAWGEAGLDIRLELGMEIYLRLDTVHELKEGRLWTMAASQYVLVELPYQLWPPYAEDALFALQVAGYVPILAHPERYGAIQADPGKMYALAARGVLGQVTAAALMGEHNSRVKKCADTLVRHNLVQFISTDAHGTGRRSPHMAEAVKAAESLVGADRAREMALDNPRRILLKEEIAPDPEPVEERKGFFGSLFGR